MVFGNKKATPVARNGLFLSAAFRLCLLVYITPFLIIFDFDRFPKIKSIIQIIRFSKRLFEPRNIFADKIMVKFFTNLPS